MKVLYVDFGNKEVVPVADLRVLISDFRTQPIQAFECCLDGIQPKNQVGSMYNVSACSHSPASTIVKGFL